MFWWYPALAAIVASALVNEHENEAMVQSNFLFATKELDSKLTDYLRTTFLPAKGYTASVAEVMENPKMIGHLVDLRQRMKSVEYYRNVAALYLKGCSSLDNASVDQRELGWPACYNRADEQLTQTGRKVFGTSFRNFISDERSWYQVGGELCGTYTYLLGFPKQRRDNFCVTLGHMTKYASKLIQETPLTSLPTNLEQHAGLRAEDAERLFDHSSPVNATSSDQQIVSAIKNDDELSAAAESERMLASPLMDTSSFLQLPYWLTLAHRSRQETTTTTTPTTTTELATTTTALSTTTQMVTSSDTTATSAVLSTRANETRLGGVDDYVEIISVEDVPAPATDDEITAAAAIAPRLSEAEIRAIIDQSWGPEEASPAAEEVDKLKKAAHSTAEKVALARRLRFRYGMMLSKKYVNVHQEEIMRAIKDAGGEESKYAWLGLQGLVHHIMIEFVHLQATMLLLGKDRAASVAN